MSLALYGQDAGWITLLLADYIFSSGYFTGDPLRALIGEQGHDITQQHLVNRTANNSNVVSVFLITLP